MADTEVKQEAAWLKWAGIIVSVIQIILAVSFVGMVFWINIFPVKIEVIIIVVLILLSALALYLQFLKYGWVKWAARVIALLLAVILAIGDLYIYQAKEAMNYVSNNEQTEVISVYVLKDDEAKTIADAKDYIFGYHEILDRENTDKYVQSINTSLNKTITSKTYNDLPKMVEALYNKQIGAMILNESYVKTLEEEFPDFEEKTKVIANEYYRTTLDKPVITKNTLTDTFTIYLSGNDECGELNQSGRSDVNILIVVNPKTKQILLINTPRDYYVNVNSLKSGIGKDKLTHAGNFGVEASMKTLSTLYDNWDIDFYVRLNFTSVEEIVDALGGITVNSEIEFYTSPDTSDEKFHFVEGPNKLNGKAALAFCRERQSVAAGDNQRGQDQMLVIEALIDKVTSPSILYNYSNVLETVRNLFQTSLDDDDIASMVKLTMEGANGWNVQSYAVEGTSAFSSSYFFGYSSMWVMEPDMSTVKTAVELMNKIKDGEVFDMDEYLENEFNGTDEKKSDQMNLFDNLEQKDDKADERSKYQSALICYAIAKLEEVTTKKLEEVGSLSLFNNIEMPLVPVLAQMQFNGMMVDESELKDFGDTLKAQVETLSHEICDLAGEEFNVNSHQQLGKILFEKLQLPVYKKTKNGYTTDVEVLEKLKGQHPIIEKILEYRTLAKLNSTYVEGLIPYINPKTKKIHSSFHQIITATGRISSTEPNLQNIPTRAELGKQIRKAFKPAEGNVYIDADYSQVELRVLAHISQDENMIHAFNHGEDIHKQAASKVLGIPIEKVTKEQRSSAKAVNFGIVYGISDFGLANQLGVSNKQAKEYINQYLEKYQGIKHFMDDIVESAKAKGYVETLFGRRRYIPEIKSSNYMVRQFGSRVAMNTPIQGTAADIMKIAMINVNKALKEKHINGKIVLQIHDELLLEVSQEDKEQAKEILKQCMENAMKLSVPLEVEISEGEDWYEVK